MVADEVDEDSGVPSTGDDVDGALVKLALLLFRYATGGGACFRFVSRLDDLSAIIYMCICPCSASYHRVSCRSTGAPTSSMILQMALKRDWVAVRETLPMEEAEVLSAHITVKAIEENRFARIITLAFLLFCRKWINSRFAPFNLQAAPCSLNLLIASQTPKLLLMPPCARQGCGLTVYATPAFDIQRPGSSITNGSLASRCYNASNSRAPKWSSILIILIEHRHLSQLIGECMLTRYRALEVYCVAAWSFRLAQRSTEFPHQDSHAFPPHSNTACRRHDRMHRPSSLPPRVTE